MDHQNINECTFIPINSKYVKEHIPYFFRSNSDYYAIIKNRKYIGLYGIMDQGKGICEGFITVFSEFRFKTFSRKVLEALFNFPLSIGYKEVWTSTTWDSWRKIFKRFEKNGIEYQLEPPIWNNSSQKSWFRKRI